jgi:hypothetical protein
MPGRAPVLFLIFNRPEPTRQVFETIRAYQPSKLYVAADGPRSEKTGEWRLCSDTREVLKQVDWECEVKTLLRDQNLGCGTAVSEAINWFFDQEEEGIILEDDCLPDPCFFTFCEEMLDRYRDHPEVGSVSGDNFLPRSLHIEQPYGFSKYVQIWGWATWRRFWKNYDFRLAGDWREWMEIIDRTNPVQNQSRYWFQIFKTLQAGLIDTWDFQVMFSSWRHGLVHIFPSRNLVTNLGYSGDATHTNFQSPLANLHRESIKDYQVTLPVTVDVEIDNATFYFRFLESLTSVWWLEQAMDLPNMLGWLRTQLSLAQKENARLEAIQQVQSRQISKILSVRSKSIVRANYTLLLGHFVYTCRMGLDLARTKANWIIARVGAKANELISRLGVILRTVLLRGRHEAGLPPTAGALPPRKNEDRESNGKYQIAATPRDREHAPKEGR